MGCPLTWAISINTRSKGARSIEKSHVPSGAAWAYCAANSAARPNSRTRCNVGPVRGRQACAAAHAMALDDRMVVMHAAQRYFEHILTSDQAAGSAVTLACGAPSP